MRKNRISPREEAREDVASQDAFLDILIGEQHGRMEVSKAARSARSRVDKKQVKGPCAGA
jgi:hypothetical protein